MAESDEVVDADIEEVDDIEALQRALTEEKERADRYLASWQRCQADLANYKKRVEQEKADIVECANSALICNILPIVDDLERALASVPSDLEESDWTEGIRLIYNKLKATLEAQGLAEIKARGEAFDPRLHEAVMQQEGEEGLVVEETQKGYKFKERVVRPSLVIVGKDQRKGQAGETTNKEKQKWEEL
ncbi:MAG: nucleotide exchange factor GrpE [Dehalococcoidia bacterium]